MFVTSNAFFLSLSPPFLSIVYLALRPPIATYRLSAAVATLTVIGHAAPEASAPAAAKVIPSRGSEVAVEVVSMLKEGAVVGLPLRAAGITGIGGIVVKRWCHALGRFGTATAATPSAAGGAGQASKLVRAITDTTGPSVAREKVAALFVAVVVQGHIGARTIGTAVRPETSVCLSRRQAGSIAGSGRRRVVDDHIGVSVGTVREVAIVPSTEDLANMVQGA